MVKRGVCLLLTHETIEELKRRHINISAYVDDFLAELLNAVERKTIIKVGRKKFQPKPRFGT